jgi:hypothetical protein
MALMHHKGSSEPMCMLSVILKVQSRCQNVCNGKAYEDLVGVLCVTVW